MPTTPTLNAGVATYVDCVFDRGDIVEVRFIWPNPDANNLPRSEWHTAAELAGDETSDSARGMNLDGWGVYVGANGRKGNGGRKAGDVSTCRCLFVDFDGVALDEARRRIEEAVLPTPTLTVASGREGGFHCYWRLTVPVADTADWRQYQRGLIKALDSDTKIHDLPRVMRLPGYDNTKYDGKPACTIIEHDAARVYDVQEFDHIKAAKTPKPPPPAAKPSDPGAPVAPFGVDTKRYLNKRNHTAEGDRNGTLFRVACDLCGRGFTKVWAEDMLRPAWRRDELSDDEAKKTIASAFGQPRTPGRDTVDSQATIITKLALASGAEPFHDASGETFITLNTDHAETWPILSGAVRVWLVGLYYRKTGSAPNSQATTDALTTLEAAARYDGPQYEVHVRVAGDDETIYIDLADDQWRAIKVTSEGWAVVDRPDIRFCRPGGMLPLPMPERGGTVDELGEFINIDVTKEDSQFPLLISWMLMAFRPTGPYPVAVLGGSHGSGKSCACKFIRALLDPNIAPLRAPPQHSRDLAITSSNSWIFQQENVSEIPQWLSDCLSMLATGSGFSTRRLYKNNEEVLFCACRPILINGIGETVTSPDLVDRSLRIDLDEIRKGDRKREKDLQADFTIAAPRILGALLDGVVEAIRNIPTTDLVESPRMADFATWAVAAEPAMPWEPGAFIKTYSGSQRDGDLVALESTPIGDVIQAFMAGRQEPWDGKAGELLDALRQQDGQDLNRRAPKSWPADAPRMGNVLHRLAPNLRSVGISVDFHRVGNRRTITISNVESLSFTVTGDLLSPAKNRPDGTKNAVRDSSDSNDSNKQDLSDGV